MQQGTRTDDQRHSRVLSDECFRAPSRDIRRSCRQIISRASDRALISGADISGILLGEMGNQDVSGQSTQSVQFIFEFSKPISPISMSRSAICEWRASIVLLMIILSSLALM